MCDEFLGFTLMTFSFEASKICSWDDVSVKIIYDSSCAVIENKTEIIFFRVTGDFAGVSWQLSPLCSPESHTFNELAKLF